MIEEFEKIIKEELGEFWFSVKKIKVLGGEWLTIKIAPDNIAINGVAGQYRQLVSDRQLVSLSYDLSTEELAIQIFGGVGGGSLTVKPKDRGRYCDRVKIPFRKVRGKEKALKAFRKFVQEYRRLLAEHKDQLL